MTTRTAGTRRPGDRPSSRRERDAAAHRRLVRHRLAWISAVLIGVALVAAALWSSRPVSTDTTRSAPDFTLPTTAGTTVTLSSLRGHPVVLYFNEGAGCGSCTQQMAAIEDDPAFAASGITVLPIVMNTAQQIEPDLVRYDVETPYLLDDGTVSAEYGVLGAGMHEGLPGHGFVLLDSTGTQRWYGNYPSMWLAPPDLLREITARPQPEPQ